MSEVRPIDATELRKYVWSISTSYLNEWDTAGVLMAIERQKILDVEPVRHGRWAHGYYPTVWYGSGEPPEWICSLCHDCAYDTYDYCPNCGARMDAKEE